MQLIRTLISTITDTANKIKLFSGSGRTNETFTDREYFQHFGFSSRPPAGSEGLCFIAGNQVFMIASDKRDLRPVLLDGETAIFIDQNNYVKIKADKTIEVKSENNVTVNAVNLTATASGQASIVAPVVTINSATSIAFNSPSLNLGVSGFLSLVTNVFISLFNSHTHGGGSAPDQQMVEGTHTTINLKAS